MNYIRQQMVCDKLTIIQQVEKGKIKPNKHRLESCNKRGICHYEIDSDFSRIKTEFPVRKRPFRKRVFLLAKISVIDS